MLQKHKSHSRPAHRAHLTAMTRQMMEARTEEEHEMASRKLHRALQVSSPLQRTNSLGYQAMSFYCSKFLPYIVLQNR